MQCRRPQRKSGGLWYHRCSQLRIALHCISELAASFNCASALMLHYHWTLGGLEATEGFVYRDWRFYWKKCQKLKNAVEVSWKRSKPPHTGAILLPTATETELRRKSWGVPRSPRVPHPCWSTFLLDFRYIRLVQKRRPQNFTFSVFSFSYFYFSLLLGQSRLATKVGYMQKSWGGSR